MSAAAAFTNLSAKEWSCMDERCVSVFFSSGMARCVKPNFVDVEDEEKLNRVKVKSVVVFACSDPCHSSARS